MKMGLPVSRASLRASHKSVCHGMEAHFISSALGVIQENVSCHAAGSIGAACGASRSGTRTGSTSGGRRPGSGSTVGEIGEAMGKIIASASESRLLRLAPVLAAEPLAYLAKAAENLTVSETA